MDLSDERTAQMLRSCGVEPSTERIKAAQEFRKFSKNVAGVQLCDAAFRERLAEIVAPLMNCGLGDLDGFVAQIAFQQWMEAKNNKANVLQFTWAAKKYFHNVDIPYQVRGDTLHVFSHDFETGSASWQLLVKRLFLIT